jgi:hypothetical protein
MLIQGPLPPYRSWLRPPNRTALASHPRSAAAHFLGIQRYIEILFLYIDLYIASSTRIKKNKT